MEKGYFMNFREDVLQGALKELQHHLKTFLHLVNLEKELGNIRAGKTLYDYDVLTGTLNASLFLLTTVSTQITGWSTPRKQAGQQEDGQSKESVVAPSFLTHVTEVPSQKSQCQRPPVPKACEVFQNTPYNPNESVIELNNISCNVQDDSELSQSTLECVETEGHCVGNGVKQTIHVNLSQDVEPHIHDDIQHVEIVVGNLAVGPGTENVPEICHAQSSAFVDGNRDNFSRASISKTSGVEGNVPWNNTNGSKVREHRPLSKAGAKGHVALDLWCQDATTDGVSNVVQPTSDENINSFVNGVVAQGETNINESVYEESCVEDNNNKKGTQAVNIWEEEGFGEIEIDYGEDEINCEEGQGMREKEIDCNGGIGEEEHWDERPAQEEKHGKRQKTGKKHKGKLPAKVCKGRVSNGKLNHSVDNGDPSLPEIDHASMTEADFEHLIKPCSVKVEVMDQGEGGEFELSAFTEPASKMFGEGPSTMQDVTVKTQDVTVKTEPLRRSLRTRSRTYNHQFVPRTETKKMTNSERCKQWLALFRIHRPKEFQRRLEEQREKSRAWRASRTEDEKIHDRMLTRKRQERHREKQRAKRLLNPPARKQPRSREEEIRHKEELRRRALERNRKVRESWSDEKRLEMKKKRRQRYLKQKWARDAKKAVILCPNCHPCQDYSCLDSCTAPAPACTTIAPACTTPAPACTTPVLSCATPAPACTTTAPACTTSAPACTTPAPACMTPVLSCTTPAPSSTNSASSCTTSLASTTTTSRPSCTTPAS